MKGVLGFTSLLKFLRRIVVLFLRSRIKRYVHLEYKDPFIGLGLELNKSHRFLAMTIFS